MDTQSELLFLQGFRSAPTINQRIDPATIESSEPSDPEVRQERARQAAINGGTVARVNFLFEEVIVHTPDFAYAVSTIEELLKYAGAFSNPGGMRLIAEAGMGKNALARYFVHKYNRPRDDDNYRCPILHLSFAHRVAAGDVLKALFRQLGAAYRSYQSIEELEDNAIEAIESCETKALFFNEAQHLVSVTQQRKRSTAHLAGPGGNWLKGFLDKVRRPVVLLGIPGWDEVFDQDNQLGTRIPLRHEFTKLQFDANYIGVLRALDRAIPMPELAGLDERSLAEDIYTVSQGNWRRKIFLLCDAIISASSAGSPRIERCDLSRAYQRRFGLRGNPFGAPRSL